MRGKVNQNGSATNYSGEMGRDGKGWGLMGLDSQSDNPNWTPTTTYLILLVLLEFAALIGLRYMLRAVHAG